MDPSPNIPSPALFSLNGQNVLITGATRGTSTSPHPPLLDFVSFFTASNYPTTPNLLQFHIRVSPRKRSKAKRFILHSSSTLLLYLLIVRLLPKPKIPKLKTQTLKQVSAPHAPSRLLKPARPSVSSNVPARPTWIRSTLSKLSILPPPLPLLLPPPPPPLPTMKNAKTQPQHQS